MRKILSTIIIALLSLNSFCQDDIISRLKSDYDSKKYDQIISEHAQKVGTYPAKAVYYIGKAYYMKADDENTLKTMDLSIKKDKSNPDPYFIKGMTYNYMGQYAKAIESFNKAIALDSSITYYFSGLGDSYFEMKSFEKALSAYITVTKKSNPIDRPFAMIPQTYVNLNQPQKALAAFYKSKQTVSKESSSYINALYNIGVYEYLNKNYNKSEIAFKELLVIEPEDYPTYAKLIQVYYGQKAYEKAEPLKILLYKAYENGELKGYLKNKFCFDQFEWNGKRILVYENFAVREGELYYKHIFYIPDSKGETQFTIQTENSPIAKELGSGKYAIGMDRDGTHSTFVFIEENFEYDVLKNIVISILDENVKPQASSRKRK